MKKILFLAVTVMIANASFSQTNKGQFMVGGDINFNSSKQSKGSAGSVTQFELNPDVGYFFANNFAAGIRGAINSYKMEDADPDTYFLIGPFARYYFLPSANKTNLFLDAAYGIGSVGSGNKEGINSYSIAAGPAFFLTPNVALEFALGYSSTGGDAYDAAIVNNRLNSFGLIGGFKIHLGAGKK